MLALAPSPSQPQHAAPYGLLSLGDLMKLFAQRYLEIGERIAEARTIFYVAGSDAEGAILSPDDVDELKDVLKRLRDVCMEAPLPVSFGLIKTRIDTPPRTVGEFDVLVDAVKSEMDSLLFLRVPSERALYYDHAGILKPPSREAFPSAYAELMKAGDSYALGLNTACVFHAMRAAEIGVRALAKVLDVKFKFPLELADWQNLLDQIASKIKAMGATPKSKKKDADLKFYSEAAAQFTYFKDAWRVRASHAREDFDAERALSILNHTTEFFDGLSSRLAEPRKK